jgi:hypothetical protein
MRDLVLLHVALLCLNRSFTHSTALANYVKFTSKHRTRDVPSVAGHLPGHGIAY